MFKGKKSNEEETDVLVISPPPDADLLKSRSVNVNKLVLLWSNIEGCYQCLSSPEWCGLIVV